MGTVVAEMSMSLDGYVAGPGDQVEALHAWYANGEVETPAAAGGFAFHTSAASAQVLHDALAHTGALITGRRNFDIAGGWGGSHPLGVPVFVVTHTTPDGWPRDNVPFTFPARRRAGRLRRSGGSGREVGGDRQPEHRPAGPPAWAPE